MYRCVLVVYCMMHITLFNHLHVKSTFQKQQVQWTYLCIHLMEYHTGPDQLKNMILILSYNGGCMQNQAKT